jgi:hypothetical protein
MPFVTGEVDVRQIGEKDWLLLAPIRYVGNSECFVVPAAFKSDFASVPSAVVWLFPRYGRYTKAAILHDFLWRTGIVTKVDANGIFRRAMRELDVPVIRRWMMWSAVGLVSAWKNPFQEGKVGFVHAMGLATVALLSLAFILVPLIVVVVWQLLFLVLETMAFAAGWIRRQFQPPAERKRLNAPRLMLPLS